MKNRSRKFLYAVSEAVSYLKTEGIMVYISILTMAFSLLIINLYFLVSLNVRDILSDIRKDAKVVAFLEEALFQNDIIVITEKIKQIEGVKITNVLSKDDAFEKAKSEHLKGEAYLLDALTYNPFPASIEMQVDESVIPIKSAAEQIRLIRGVEDVSYGAEILERISVFTGIVKFILLTIGIVFLVASIYIILNTIKLTIFSKKTEIEIMKLVGATDRFIKLPFLLVGMLQGVIASFVCLGILYLTYRFFVYKYQVLEFLPFEIIFFDIKIVAYIILIGVFIGFIGSYSAVRKVIKHL